MLPSTILGLVLLIVVLLPGAAHIKVRQLRWPERDVSPLWETLRLITISVVADALALLLFGLCRVCAPGSTPDVGALVREPGPYARSHYVSLLWWSLVLLLVAVCGAAWCGTERAARLAARLPVVGRHVPEQEHPSRVSAWWQAFNEWPEARVQVGCLLEDGAYWSGWLRSYSNRVSDDAERELVLGGPLQYRPPGAVEAAELPDTGAVILSARRITAITVTYVVSPTSAPSASSASPSSTPPP
ncbi:hypothetical protein GCM10011583_08870 [Streptomyces camponoticapitis]|uniref:Uncharacterized protein n=1 Tax=Streptomyces camponoticapitis TaxID=1616125 RepID=A0ABQ2DZK4_9ACTN|nr:DUF6338 family protein [Streptomyces camponoticapitis]GGJ79535.1 hypothetical protein GCM10011583_08870 [Streptomyces camponoticapitis]